MTPREGTLWLVGYIAVLALLVVLAGCSNEARVQFKSCEEAREVGAPLPLTPGDVGWNARLDVDKDGLACE